MVTKKDKTEKKYDGWIVSNNFFKRAFAIFGHQAVVQIIMLLLWFLV